MSAFPNREHRYWASILGQIALLACIVWLIVVVGRGGLSGVAAELGGAAASYDKAREGQ